MRTTLPTLSYSPAGFTWSEDAHSSAYTEERAYPRTDLANFVPWVGFEADIHHAITARMGAMNISADTEYDIGSMPKIQKIVECEEALRSQAEVQLHDLVQEVLGILGIEGRFERPNSWNNQIVGEPDFSWLRKPTLHPMIVVRISLISVFIAHTSRCRLSTRQNGRPLLMTCLGIFNRKIVDSQSTLCTNSTAI
jgi:hypothetical protein